jgi:predicted nucleic acid-binding protein
MFKEREAGELRYCTSALLEMALVLQSRGLVTEKIEETLLVVRQKLFESNVREERLDSDDVIRLYELLKKFDVRYFDAMHAAVALGRNAILITNDEVYKTLNVKTITFEDLIKTKM